MTWGEAIVKSYMSDIEVLTEEEQQSLAEKLTEAEKQFLKK